MLPATQERELHAEAIGDLEERLEQQRNQEWAAYGQALKVNIEAAAARRDGLTVPVVVNVDLLTFRRDQEAPWGLAEQLLQAGIESTPVPGENQPPPLERLDENAPGDRA